MLDKIFSPYVPTTDWHAGPYSLLRIILNALTATGRLVRLVASLAHLAPLSFVAKFLERLGCKYTVVNLHVSSLPPSGSAIVVANHPTGPIDGLWLLDVMGTLGTDVVALVKGLIIDSVQQMQTLLLDVDSTVADTAKAENRKIMRARAEGKVVIVFAAGLVSDWTRQGTLDRPWNPCFLKLAQGFDAPILPVFIEVRNSLHFYVAHRLHLNLSFMLLICEMFSRSRRAISTLVNRSMLTACSKTGPITRPPCTTAPTGCGR